MHKRIKYSYLSNTHSRDIRSASDEMKAQIKLLTNKTCHSVILEYVLKDKYMKEFESEMCIFITSLTHEK